MMMTDREMDRLDAVLAQARCADVAVTDALMARVLADAAREQARLPVQAVRLRGSGPVAWLHDLIGGWPALGGVLAAGLAGLWVGVAPPEAVETLAAGFLGQTQAVTFLPETDLSLFEDPSDG